MRDRIYRKLDEKVHFFGLTYPQIGVLCALTVGASELLKQFEVTRGCGALHPFWILTRPPSSRSRSIFSANQKKS